MDVFQSDNPKVISKLSVRYDLSSPTATISISVVRNQFKVAVPISAQPLGSMRREGQEVICLDRSSDTYLQELSFCPAHCAAQRTSEKHRE